MKKIFTLMILSVLASVTFLFAQGQEQTAIGDQAITESAPPADENMQAGQYTRKSVSFINALWLLDKDTRGLQSERVGYMLDRIQKGISMKRFDYNPLPDAMLTAFVDKANAMDKLTIDDVAKLMESELVPQIMKILESDAEMRGANLLTEQQKNSFLSDKAKELGVTGEQIEKILNSAYLYIPVLADFSIRKSGSGDKEKWVSSAKIGILWYSLSLKGEKPTVTLRVKKMTTTLGMAKVKSVSSSLLTGGGVKGYSMDGESVTEDEYAFRSMAKSAVKNLVVATQEIPDFKLSGQVLEVSGGTIGFDVGKNEGLNIDDKYKIMQLTENADGSVTEVCEGWVFTTLVADSNSKEGYKSKAKVVSGSPMTGAVLREYPRLGIDIALKFRTFPGVKNEGDSVAFGTGLGVQIDARYDIGKKLKWPQLFVGIGYGLGATGTVGDAVDTSWYDGAAYSNLDFFVLQRFYISRFTVGGEVGYASQSITPSIKGIATVASNSTSGGGMFFGGNLGMAITPSLNLEASARYELGSLDDNPGFSHSGLGIHAGLTYSPASLPFDPWEMLRGMSGI